MRPSGRNRARTRCPAARCSTASYGHAEGVGDELREDRLGPLAHLGRGGQDPDPALGGQLERGDRGELDLARAGEPGAVPGEREPDAGGRPLATRSAAASPGSSRSPLAPARSRRRVARAQPLELGRPRRRARGPPRRPRCRAGPGRSGSCRRAVDVPPADLERARCPSASAIRLRWVSAANSDLRRPEPAERAVRRRVRPRRAGPDPDVRAAVRAAGVDRAARQDDRRERAVRAAVHDDLDVLRDEPAVVGHAGPVADDRRVALGRRRDVLVTVVDHPDRPARPCSARSAAWSAMTDGYSSLPAEPAAGLGLDDPGLRVVDREAPLERGVDVVRALERAVDRDAAVVGRHRDHRVVLDVQLLLVTDPVLALEDEVGRGEGRIGVAGGQLVGARTRDRTPRGSKTAGSGSVRRVSGAARGAQGRRGPARRGAPAARHGAGSRRRSGRGSAGPP